MKKIFKVVKVRIVSKSTTEESTMRLIRIANQCTNYKGFIFEESKLKDNEIIFTIRPRKSSKAICSGCGNKSPGYDYSKTRLFEMVPIWGMKTFYEYRMRRVNCVRCQRVVTERIPWAEGKETTTKEFQIFLASWSEVLSWKVVSRRFKTSWEKVYRAVSFVVAYGLDNRDLDGVEAIGVDEVKFQLGHKYLTLVYQLNGNCRRLLWIGKDRTKTCFRNFFDEMEFKQPGFCEDLKYICSDMWKNYIEVAAEKASNALNIVDRFHIMQKFGKALDRVRIDEVKRLHAEGYEPVLTHSKFCFLKRVQNLTSKQAIKLKDLLSMNLRSVRAYLLKEEFNHFWEYKQLASAQKFFHAWCKKAMYSKIEPIKDVVKTLRRHEELIFNWFRAKKLYNNSITEGLNYNVKLTMRNSYGFRTEKAIKVALYHKLAHLPRPRAAHEFC